MRSAAPQGFTGRAVELLDDEYDVFIECAALFTGGVIFGGGYVGMDAGDILALCAVGVVVFGGAVGMFLESRR